MIKTSSIDEHELNKFNKTCDEWWNEFGEFRMLHKITPLRVEYIVQKAITHFELNSLNKRALENLEILDVGCGGGLVSVPLFNYGAKVTAIDANSYNIKAALEHSEKYKLDINFLNHTAEDHLELNKQYDIVVCLEVIEHVANPAAFVQTLTSLVKPYGMIILSTINRNAKSYALAIIAAEYILGWLPRGTHDYTKFIKPSEVQHMLASTNKNIKELIGMNYNIINNKWSLDNNIDINYIAYIA